jgi:hypothetical protein
MHQDITPTRKVRDSGFFLEFEAPETADMDAAIRCLTKAGPAL